MAYRKIPIRQHEVTVAEDVVVEGQRTLSESAPSVILVDRCFISAPMFGRWKKAGLDVVVPVKRNMHFFEDMRCLARSDKGLVRTGSDAISVHSRLFAVAPD